MSLQDWIRSDAAIGKIEVFEDRLLPVQKFMLESYKALLRGDLKGKYQNAKFAYQVDPNASTAWELGWSAIEINRPRGAIEIFKTVDPESGLVKEWLLFWGLYEYAHYMLGEYKKEIEIARQAQKSFPDDRAPIRWEIRAQAALGRTAEIDRLLMKLQTLPSLPDRALYSNCYEAGRALRVHGYRKESAEYFERAFAELRNRPESEKASVIYRSDLVNCLMALDKWDEARDEIEALDKADPDNLSHQFLGALIAAKLGNREEAQRISDELGRVEQPYPLSFIIPFYQGGIAAFLGEKDKAVKFLQKAHAHGLGFGTANMFPFNQALEPLFDYPPFKEFVKPKG
jgi:tetratricopeptide (TPR) repeat protein